MMPVDNSAWADDQFAPIDTRVTKEDLPDGTVQVPNDELDSLPDVDIEKLMAGIRTEKAKPRSPVTYTDVMSNQEVLAQQDEVPQNLLPQPETPQPVAVSPYPKVIELQDGATITFEQTKRGLRATLDSGTGANAERFYGKDESELLQQIAVGKVNATRKIHNMTRDQKLGQNQPEIDPNPPQTGRNLTPEESDQIKLLYKTDPLAAQEKWYEIRTGQKPEQANEAKIELHLESVAKSFKIARPNYLTTDENMFILVASMVRDFLRQTITEQQIEAGCVALAKAGFWTVKNLCIYFDGLLEAGLLQTEQVEVDDEIDEDVDDEVVTPAPVAVAPAPKPAAQPQPQPTGRIVRPRAGSQASYGIRQSAQTAAPVEDSKGPSDAELDNLSDEQISQLFAGVRRAKLNTRR